MKNDEIGKTAIFVMFVKPIHKILQRDVSVREEMLTIMVYSYKTCLFGKFYSYFENMNQIFFG